jgi:hypothetical protein
LDATEHATQPRSHIILEFQEQANDGNPYKTEKLIAYIQSEIGQLATARLLDIGR